MVVFLVPVGASRYQLYVEIAGDDSQQVAAEPEGSGWASRQVQRFRAMLAEAERERLRRESGEPEQGSGLWRFILRKIAEFIAEQRLLWHLRHQTQATVRHPDDLTGAKALKEVRAEFSRDVTKHLVWMVLDGLIALVTGVVLGLVPGPNFIAWYFVFRMVGHFFSWRGARKGLREVAWDTDASATLTAIRQALGLPSHERRLRLLEIGDTLELKHLAGFVERVSRTK